MWKDLMLMIFSFLFIANIYGNDSLLNSHQKLYLQIILIQEVSIVISADDKPVSFLEYLSSDTTSNYLGLSIKSIKLKRLNCKFLKKSGLSEEYLIWLDSIYPKNGHHIENVSFYELVFSPCTNKTEDKYIISIINGKIYRLAGFRENDYKWFYKDLHFTLFTADHLSTYPKFLQEFILKRNRRKVLPAYKWIEVENLDLKCLHNAFKKKGNSICKCLYSNYHNNCYVEVGGIISPLDKQSKFSVIYPFIP